MRPSIGLKQDHQGFFFLNMPRLTPILAANSCCCCLGIFAYAHNIINLHARLSLFIVLMFNNLDIFNNQSYTMNIMAQKKLTLLPSVERRLEQMGEQIKLARLRRRISVQLVAERANISRSTLWAIEKGSPSVSMGAYAQVLLAIGLVDDLLLIAKDDVLGRKLQDLELPVGKRAPKGEA